MNPDLKYVNFLHSALSVNLFYPEIYLIFPDMMSEDVFWIEIK